MAAGMWAGLADMAMEGVDYVADAVGMGDGKAVGAAADMVPAIPSASEMMSGTGAAMKGLGAVAEDPESWVGDVLKPAMSSILGAAMKPKPTARAGMGGAGHGVSASGGTAMQPFNEVTKLASDDPLEGLNKWVGMFG